MTNYIINNEKIMKDWNYEKNNELGLDPNKLTDGMHTAAYFKCSKCGYEWSTRIDIKSNHGCPACAGKVVRSGYNDLATRNPLAAEEWDYELNYPLTPSEVNYKSDKRAYFKCKKCGYVWETRINRRIDCGCPVCANRIVVPGVNDLATTHPLIAKRWDYEKNGDLKPTDVTAGSGKIAYFICDHGHSYCGQISKQKDEGNCPECRKSQQTSFSEQATFKYIKKVYPDAENKVKGLLGNEMELDIYIPSLNIGVEYDGTPWHREDELEREHNKYIRCKERGIYLIRIRESEHNSNIKIADTIVMAGDVRKRSMLDKAICETIKIIDKLNNISYVSHNPLEIRKGIIINSQKDAVDIANMYLCKSLEDNFEILYPEHAKDWDYENNGNLKPNMVSKSSRTPISWVCNGCGKSYITAVADKIKTGHYCETCRRQRRKIVASWGNNIYQFDKNNKLIKKWTSITDICKAYNVRNYVVIDAILNKNYNIEGYTFKCMNKFNKPYESTIVCKLDENGNILKEYKDIFAVANELDCAILDIYSAVIGRGKKTSHGFIWKYKDDLKNN